MDNVHARTGHVEQPLQVGLVLSRSHQFNPHVLAPQVHVLQRLQSEVQVFDGVNPPQGQPSLRAVPRRHRHALGRDGHVARYMNICGGKGPKHVLDLHGRARVPAHMAKPAQQTCCSQKQRFLGGLDGHGACAQHASRRQHHADAQLPRRPQRLQRKRHTEQAVQVHHVRSGRIRSAAQFGPPPSQGQRRRVSDPHAVLVVGRVADNASQRFLVAQIAGPTHHFEGVGGLGIQQLNEVVDTSDRPPRFVRRRVPFHHGKHAQWRRGCRIIQGHGAQGSLQARQGTTPGSKTTSGLPP